MYRGFPCEKFDEKFINKSFCEIPSRGDSREFTSIIKREIGNRKVKDFRERNSKFKCFHKELE